MTNIGSSVSSCQGPRALKWHRKKCELEAGPKEWINLPSTKVKKRVSSTEGSAQDSGELELIIDRWNNLCKGTENWKCPLLKSNLRWPGWRWYGKSYHRRVGTYIRVRSWRSAMPASSNFLSWVRIITTGFL